MNRTHIKALALVITVLSIVGCGNSSSISDQSNSEYSSSEEIITRLATPILVYDEAGLLSWDAIAHAEKYELEIDSASLLVIDNEYEFEEYGTYSVRIRALANSETNFLSSYWSEILECEYTESIIGYILLNTSSISLKMDDVYQLDASLSTGLATNLIYSVSVSGLILIENGLISPMNVGVATITVSKHGYIPAYCYIEVLPAIYFEEGPSLFIDQGESRTLTLVRLPRLDDSDMITFSSSNPDTVYVGSNGTISGLAVGVATIEAHCSNGAEADIQITVNEVLPAVVSFTVTIPQVLGEGYEVYLVGSFNNWTVTDPSYKLTKSENNNLVYSATFTSFIAKTNISYKYILKTPTSYCWEAYNGDNLANRALAIAPGPTQVNDTVTIWQTPVVA
ncbi:MAG: Ig-like domain-containing protein [Bacilli bacterium]